MLISSEKQQKREIMKVVIILISILVLFSIPFIYKAHKDKTQIERVYNGQLNAWPGQQIGLAFDSYLTNEKWVYKEQDDEKLVIVTGQDSENNHLKIIFFLKEEEGFNISKIVKNGRECDDYDLLYIVEDIMEGNSNYMYN